MDSWATDGFYSHFPSYSQQPNRREELARARQLDYQTYLNNVTPRKEKSDGKITKRHTNIDFFHKKPKVAPSNATPNKQRPKVDLSTTAEHSRGSDKRFRVYNTSQFVNELEKKELPDILNEHTINERNQKLAEEKRLKSIRYQQELMEQIENKRRERELQRAKEQEEEDRFLKKMEEQLKLIRSEDDFECQSQSRQRELINVEINKPIVTSQYTKPPATVRSEQLDPTVYTFRSYDDRKAQSERGKENRELPKRNDKSIYNYFTNTAQKQANQLKNLRYSHYFDMDDSSENEIQPNSMSSSSPIYKTYPTKSVRHSKPLCSFCKATFSSNNQADKIGQDFICDLCGIKPICLNCRKTICVQCKRPTKTIESVLKVSPRHLKQRNHDAERPKIPIKPQTKPSRLYTESFQQIQTDEDESSSESPNRKPPYSFNISESSVFHPSKSRVNRRLSVSIRNGEVIVQPDSFDELKRITEEKSMKLSKSYGDIRAKKFNDDASTSTMTKEHPPFLRENTRKLIEFAKEMERSDHNIYNRIESKHQVPAVQQKQIFQNNDTNTSTLTQVGAIKKQLQLDKLNF